MQGPSTRKAIRASASLHARALGLAAILLAAFIAAAGLYSIYGYKLVFFVYELQQVYRAEDREGRAAAEQYEDYLRADPASLRMRGRLVDQLIHNGDFDAALAAAEAAPANPAAADQALVLVLTARARLARGDVDAAVEAYREVLRLSSESAEAHYGLAQAHAARGEFSRMRDEFAAAQRKLSTGSTTEFAKGYLAALDSLEKNAKTPEGEASDAAQIARALDLVRAARIDEALVTLRSVRDFEDAPPAARFWRGVADEAAGEREAARGHYSRAAQAGLRLAIAGELRLAAAE